MTDDYPFDAHTDTDLATDRDPSRESDAELAAGAESAPDTAPAPLPETDPAADAPADGSPPAGATDPSDEDALVLLPPVTLDDAPPALRQRKAASSGHWYSLGGESPLAASATADASVEESLARRRSSARERIRQRKLRRERGQPDNWASAIIGAALLGVTAVMTLTIFFLMRSSYVAGSTVATSVPQEPTSVFYGAAGGALAGQSMVINPWQGDDRLTVLLMGKDKRPGEFGTAFLTDTMMLISLDPSSKRIGVLSIPRDLQVEIPGYNVQSINTAYRLGELDYAGGGAQLAMQTVQFNLGIPVNEYAVVDFEAFITIIDEIGGIDVEVKATIDDPEYPDMAYGYEHFYLPQGWHHLDGATALKFARTRHQSDDIDRAYRQQQVLYAVRDKVVSANMLPDLALKAYPLYAELQESIDTSLSLDQMLELAWFAKDVARSNIVSGVIGWEYIIAENWAGRPIIRPDREKIPALMRDIFGPDYAGTAGEASGAEPSGAAGP